MREVWRRVVVDGWREQKSSSWLWRRLLVQVVETPVTNHSPTQDFTQADDQVLSRNRNFENEKIVSNTKPSRSHWLPILFYGFAEARFSDIETYCPKMKRDWGNPRNDLMRTEILAIQIFLNMSVKMRRKLTRIKFEINVFCGRFLPLCCFVTNTLFAL